MNDLKERLLDAQKKAISIRPKVGGFPVFAEVLRQAGVEVNRWSLPSCQSIFILKEGCIVQQGTPLVTGIIDIPTFNLKSLITAIRDDQAGNLTFPEFLKATWAAGVVGYDVDFNKRTVKYFGTLDETHLEEYPSAEVTV